MTFQSFERDLYINDCGREACAPNHQYGPAMRGYHLMHIVASGRGVFDNGTKRFELHAGQGFMIFPEDITVYTADKIAPWDYVWIGFSGSQAEALVRSAELSAQNPVFDLGKYAETALKIAYSVYEDMSMLLSGQSAAIGGLLRLMAYIAQSRFDASAQRSLSAGSDSYQRALWALNANYQRSDFHIEDVASFVGLSRSQLFRVFKAHAGRSPQSVLVELRISHAKRLLSGTDLSLTETALSSGFSSSSRLCEIFRDVLGTTPVTYRENERQKKSGDR